MRRRTFISLLAVAPIAIARAAEDPVFVVIVNPKHPARELDKKSVADAFLKKRTRWDDDESILPVDQRVKSAVRAQFSRRILDRSVQSVRTYWNQLVFSGRGVPPPEVETDAAVIAYVATNVGSIGYVSASAADLRRVKVVQVR